jgi:hypothetical protein
MSAYNTRTVMTEMLRELLFFIRAAKATIDNFKSL